MRGKGGDAIRVGRAEEPNATGLHQTVLALVRDADLDRSVNRDPEFFGRFMARLNEALETAFARAQPRALYDVHRSLYLLYEQNFSSPADARAANQFHPFLMRVRHEIECAWERREMERARPAANAVPESPEQFAAFFKGRCGSHRLARHPLFDFLALQATREQIVGFFQNDRALILRFADLVSLAMVGADDEVRGELAANLWDEMGNGDPVLRHTRLFQRLLAYVGCDADGDASAAERFVDVLDWQGLAGYNLHLFFSLNRRNYWKSVGCLGSSEFMDGGQYAKLLKGCRRVGLDDAAELAYYATHVEVDASHGETWLANVLVPLVVKYPRSRHEIALGAEMRLNVTADYFDALLRKLAASPRRGRFEPAPAPRESFAK